MTRCSTAKGWTKDGDGMWQDETGQPVKLEIISFFDFTIVGPVIVEQLKRAGINATYSEPPDMFDRFFAGDYTGCALRPRRQLSRDVYDTLRALPERLGGDPRRPPRQLLALAQRRVRQAGRRAVRHQPDRHGQGHGHLEEGMEIWLPDYPDIQLTQGFHRLPMNTTYWTNWPTQDNPYINPAHCHLTLPLVMHSSQASRPA